MQACSRAATSGWLKARAAARGVVPRTLTTKGSALACNKRHKISVCPFWAAIKRGVTPLIVSQIDLCVVLKEQRQHHCVALLGRSDTEGSDAFIVSLVHTEAAA